MKTKDLDTSKEPNLSEGDTDDENEIKKEVGYHGQNSYEMMY